MKSNWERNTVKILLAMYILFCFIIAGLNFGYYPSASEKVQKIIHWVWFIYENEMKTLLIIICSILTISIILKTHSVSQRKKNLYGLIIAALAVHIIIPRLINNSEIYFFSMPFPWSTSGFQIMENTTSMYSNVSKWGTNSVLLALIFFIAINIMVFLGTLIWGRRFQCSTICLFNGFAAEIFSEAIPLVGKKKKMSSKLKYLLNITKWFMIVIALLYNLYWILRIGNIVDFGVYVDTIVAKSEIYKYLVLELIIAMLFWIFSSGRAYCRYCPTGTVLGLISKFAGQKIITTKSKCIKCGKCNEICSMEIEIKEKALAKENVIDSNCVGCCHCVDVCPAKTLEYSTKVLGIVKGKN